MTLYGRCRTCASPYRGANDGGPIRWHRGVLSVDRSAPRGSSRPALGRDGFSSTRLDNSQSKNKECQSTHGPPVEASTGRIETRRQERAGCLHPAGNQALSGLHPRQTPPRPALRRDRVASSRLASNVRVRDGAIGCRTAYRRIKILNHQAGTISGVAAVYQRHDFLAERRAALDQWGAHIDRILAACPKRDKSVCEPLHKVCKLRQPLRFGDSCVCAARVR